MTTLFFTRLSTTSSQFLLKRNSTHWAIAGCIVSAMLFSTSVTGTPLSEAQTRYQRDRAVCLSGTSNQDQKTCLTEAEAALAEVKRGRTVVLEESQYQSNRTNRCELVQKDDREACLRRMRGEGETTGSAATGGIFRELSRPADPAPLK